MKILFVAHSRNISHNLRHGNLRSLQSPVTYPTIEFPNIKVTHPLKLFPDSLPGGQYFNEWAFRRHVSRVAKSLEMKNPVLWLNPHGAVHMAGRMNESAVVYDVTDDWASMSQRATLRRRIQAQDAALCRKADAVIVCSERLYEMKRTLTRRVHLIHNGVDVEFYRSVLDCTQPIPESARRWESPVLGYTGTIHQDRMDLELLECVAGKLRRGTIVMIGPNHLSPREIDRLTATGRVVFTGPVPYAQIPDYMRAFQVCIVPHVVSPFTESLNPLKLWEYLAAGKPIVSTPVAGFRDYPHLVRLADSPEAFLASVGEALVEDRSAPELRRNEAAKYTWADRVDAIERVLRAAVRGRSATNVAEEQSHRWSDLKADIRLLCRGERSRLKRVVKALTNRGAQAVFLYRLSHASWRARVPLFPMLLTRIAQHLFAVRYRVSFESWAGDCHHPWLRRRDRQRDPDRRRLLHLPWRDVWRSRL